MLHCAFYLKTKITLLQINDIGITDVADYLQLERYVRMKAYIIYEQFDVVVKTWKRDIRHVLKLCLVMLLKLFFLHR